VSNVLKEENKYQVIALGRLGWSLRRIQKETGIRRETTSSYLKAACGPAGQAVAGKTGQLPQRGDHRPSDRCRRR